MRTVEAASAPTIVRRTVRAKPLRNNDKTAADGADAKIPHLSGGQGKAVQACEPPVLLGTALQ
jgi:hypothetical protein